MFKFLNSRATLAASALILLQGALTYSAIRPESVPSSRPLSQLPGMLGSWKLVEEGLVDAETRGILNADDLLNRIYADGRTGASLFIAAFRSQRDGKAPHSPKNCLPGNGWTPMTSEEIALDVGGPAPIQVNRYVVAHGDERSLVLYWYQSRNRTVANEYAAKFWVVVDALRLNRTDTALVRVIVPIANRDEQAANRAASDFARALYGRLREYLPA
ncbi:MAG: EpsI family protein [Bryobacterales bacterium]|nr:EpsI family protein [Bryobacterales bacterium]